MIIARNRAAPLALLLVLGACVTDDMVPVVTEAPPQAEATDPSFYAARADGNRMLSAIDTTAFHPALLRNRVPFQTEEAPGTVVIDTKGPFLYLVEPDGTALRYGISIGKEGFGWTGQGRIARSARWPSWTPPPEMIARDPSLARWKGGMPGGPNNPLGARALYIYQDGRDTIYRLHGTPETYSIGTAVSSGCVRLINQDIIDLYNRVPSGTTVVVLNRGSLQAPSDVDEMPPPDDDFGSI